jgi:DNA-binding transcriptional ArsR family regulator
MKRGLRIITDPDAARVLVDPMRREMIRILSETPMTQNELAATLGLSDPSVGHHLKILKKAGFVRLGRQEAEEHGILKKFYETTALSFLVDGRKMPLEIERYFMPVNLERARGIISAFNLESRKSVTIPTRDLEEFAKLMTDAILQAAPRFVDSGDLGREQILLSTYENALRILLKKPEDLPVSVRDMVTRLDKTVRFSA